MKVAIVGCGVISRAYAERIMALEELELVGVTDRVRARAEGLATELGVRPLPSLQAVLADPEIDTIVNLTVPQVHAEVTARCLAAGKHVHSEKPLALTHAEARELVDLARQNGVRLSCAPTTYLGEAQQTAWKLVREGSIGRVRVAYAEANWGRLERWHPAPQSLYAVGPLVDVGIYPIAMLTAIFGRVVRVTAHATMLEPDRITDRGVVFTPGAPDFVVAMLEHAQGILARVTATFYVPPSKQRGLELHGDLGSIYLPTWDVADARLQRCERDGDYVPVEPVRAPYAGIDWGRPLLDLRQALRDARPHRASAEHAAHVVEILEAAATSSREQRPVDVHSDFPATEPMEWAR